MKKTSYLKIETETVEYDGANKNKPFRAGVRCSDAQYAYHDSVNITLEEARLILRDLKAVLEEVDKENT